MRAQPFGTTADGQPVRAITIGSSRLWAQVLTFGAALQDVRLAGRDYPLTLGSPQIAAYEGPFKSFGTVMGPVANRLRGARASVDGQTLSWPANVPGGHLLHSGPGVQSRVWEVATHGRDHVSLVLALRHMEDGFPGDRRLSVSYRVTGAALRLEIALHTDRPTLASLVNHSYWCLDPQPGFDGQALRVAADRYTVLDGDLVATGETAAVDGGPYDFQTARALGDSDRLDINLCTAQAPQPLRPVAWLTGRTGLQMEMASTAPGLQVYDGQGIGGAFDTHHGRPYAPRAGLALEAQHWPNAPHCPGFPSIRATPDSPFHQITQWRFDG